MRRRWLLVVTALALAALVTVPVLTASAAPARTGSARAAVSAASWPRASGWASWGKDLSGSRYNGAETAINPHTVSQLEYKWAFTFPKIPGVYPGSQPAVVGNTLYVGSTDAKFYALDARTGATKWVFDLTSIAGAATNSDPDPVRDGPAVADGAVYFGDSRGYIYALDEYTGQLRWSAKIGDEPFSRITASPVVFDGKVFVGISQEEASLQLQNLDYPCCVGRGQMVALNAFTGAVEWRHYTVAAAQPVGTWPSGATDYAPSGGSVEDAAVIDPRTRTLYFGTGENASGTDGETDALVALNLDTGQLRWYYKAQIDTFTTLCDYYPEYAAYCPQAANGTDHDWDMMSSPNIFRIGDREVVGIGEKSGVYRAFDALTGQLLWSDQLSTNANATGGDAGMQWGTSFDGNHLYVATWLAQPGVLYALDPATGAIQWQTSGPSDGCTTGGAAGQSQSCTMGFGAAVSSSPGLVYEGNTDGKMLVFSADTGAVLWQFDTDQQFTGVNGVGHGASVSGLGGAVVSGGMLYVQSGYYPLGTGGTEPTVLLAFGLPGNDG
jgi:polyvinyl alcohol dehydrogenase (cytochrome)